MDKSKTKLLEQRLIAFGVQIMKLCDLLPDSKAGKHIEGQIIRSGTAPALVYAEAQSAESKADFVHKMKLGLKEMRETFVSLQMITLMGWVEESIVAPLRSENDELISIFVASVRTALGK
ncbi:MAG: four helix bundle protein [Chitinophagaceae bacterium]|nr:MAG: four helix bundle protein [Chitinophagaceae bacterium]